MTVYSAFTVPALGMMGQSHALATIGNNIANVNTGGFKRTDTKFSTVLSETVNKQSDLGGVKPKDLNQITQMGNLVGTNRNMDLAINGEGFFILSNKLSSGETFYGRDGSFEMNTVNDITVTGNGGTSITTKDGYLVDKNGYYVQGWTADPVTGLFSSTTLSALRIDPYAFAATGQATTTADLHLNLPATDTARLTQVTELGLSGTIEAGDKYSVTVDGTTVEYTVLGTEANLNAVRTALVSAINANTTISAKATASASVTDNKILITGKTLTDALTVTSTATNGGATSDNAVTRNILQNATAGSAQYYNIDVYDSNGKPRSVRLDFAKTSENNWDLSTTVGKAAVAQVDTVTLAGTVEAGDKYTVTLDGLSFTHTAVGTDTLATISAGLVTQINSNSSVKATAAASGTTALTLTAKTAGTGFTTTSGATNGAATADNTATTATTTANVSALDTQTTAVSSLTFKTDGSLSVPTTGTVTLSLSFPATTDLAASTATVTLDISKLTQFAGDFQPFSYTKNGYIAANAQSIKFDSEGQVIATFDDSSYRAVYKIPLAQFANANALEETGGNVYRQTEASGTPLVVDVGTTGYASLLPNTHELSNVDLAGEFTRMMMTQTAYNSSATVFKTVDEMVTAARDLKR